jgi:hypothetical protein
MLIRAASPTADTTAPMLTCLGSTPAALDDAPGAPLVALSPNNAAA